MSELYLSRLLLDPRRRAVQRALADSHALHQLVLTGFPNADASARQTFGVLYRAEIDPGSGVPTLVVQSSLRPDWSRFGQEAWLAAGEVAEVKPVDAAYAVIAPGALLRFRLRANPTRRVHASRTDDKLAGKRVDLRTDKERESWIAEKLRGAGCRLVGCEMRDEATHRGRREGMRLSHGAVLFDGLLRVEDTAALGAAIRQGIGSGKAYGFGLLSVAPARG